MKAFKAASGFSVWLVRLTFSLLLFLTYYQVFLNFNLNFQSFWFAAVFVVFSVLLFAGGFMNSSSLTVFSGLIIFLAAVVKIILEYNGIHGITQLLLIAALGFYFLSNGNKK